MFSQNQSEVKLEWMYKGAQSSVDREDYLLGKSIDKSLEQLNAQEKQQQLGVQQPKNHVEHECIPPSIRDYKEQIGEQVDINAKLQEDPLIAIKKQEEEKRRQFLNNPIQIKKLQKALKMQKNIKKKKRKNSSSESEEDLDIKLAKKLKSLKSSNILHSKSSKTPKKNMLDTILMHKYNELKNQLSQTDLTDILQGKKVKSSSESSSDDDSESSTDKSRKKKSTSDKYKNKFKLGEEKKRRRSSSIEDQRKQTRKNVNRRERTEDAYHLQKKSHRDSSSSSNYYKDRRDPSKKRHSPQQHTSSRNQKHEESFKKKSTEDRKRESSSDSDTDVRKKSWGLIKADGTKIPLSKNSVSKAPPKYDPYKDNKAINYKKREVLTEEEKERRRQEMIQNASWRDKERASNLKVYREIQSQEEMPKNYNPDFLKKELLKSANSSSVESRIKANINNIQRSGKDMSRHFSKR
ncbi:hypothetical protein RN001_008911 [Aquatica leii]|uniref:Pre-mRNA-splicing factor CWC25 homolog n=1 Tax=Aquatica leii TaxID=1421715 RepID=A0AAN7P4V4_9COLE|nr:hypothetical protein RN001_008911 [Aquatica leii]